MFFKLFITYIVNKFICWITADVFIIIIVIWNIKVVVTTAFCILPNFAFDL